MLFHGTKKTAPKGGTCTRRSHNHIVHLHDMVICQNPYIGLSDKSVQQIDLKFGKK